MAHTPNSAANPPEPTGRVIWRAARAMVLGALGGGACRVPRIAESAAAHVRACPRQANSVSRSLPLRLHNFNPLHSMQQDRHKQHGYRALPACLPASSLSVRSCSSPSHQTRNSISRQQALYPLCSVSRVRTRVLPTDATCRRAQRGSPARARRFLGLGQDRVLLSHERKDVVELTLRGLWGRIDGKRVRKLAGPAAHGAKHSNASLLPFTPRTWQALCPMPV